MGISPNTLKWKPLKEAVSNMIQRILLWASDKTRKICSKWVIVGIISIMLFILSLWYTAEIISSTPILNVPTLPKENDTAGVIQNVPYFSTYILLNVSSDKEYNRFLNLFSNIAITYTVVVNPDKENLKVLYHISFLADNNSISLKSLNKKRTLVSITPILPPTKYKSEKDNSDSDKKTLDKCIPKILPNTPSDMPYNYIMINPQKDMIHTTWVTVYDNVYRITHRGGLPCVRESSSQKTNSNHDNILLKPPIFINNNSIQLEVIIPWDSVMHRKNRIYYNLNLQFLPPTIGSINKDLPNISIISKYPQLYAIYWNKSDQYSFDKIEWLSVINTAYYTNDKDRQIRMLYKSPEEKMITIKFHNRFYYKITLALVLFFIFILFDIVKRSISYVAKLKETKTVPPSSECLFYIVVLVIYTISIWWISH